MVVVEVRLIEHQVLIGFRNFNADETITNENFLLAVAQFVKLVRDHKFSLSCEHRVLDNEVVERVISNFVNHFRHPVYSFDRIDICSFSLTERLILCNLLHNIVVDEFVRQVDINHLAIETVHFGDRTHSFLFL